MVTQEFLGRNQLVDRLAAQVGDRDMAVGILVKNGLMTADGKLTAKGQARNAMTAEERAIDRAVKRSGKNHGDYVYDPKTNRATLRKR
jgi:hypothetical protein